MIYYEYTVIQWRYVMDNYNSQYYYQPEAPKPEPRGKAITSMVLGILSIYLGSVPGIVLSILAKKYAAPILAEFPETTSANFAKAGHITGTVGLIVSIIQTVILTIYLFIYFIVYFIMLAGILGYSFS